MRTAGFLCASRSLSAFSSTEDFSADSEDHVAFAQSACVDQAKLREARREIHVHVGESRYHFAIAAGFVVSPNIGKRDLVLAAVAISGRRPSYEGLSFIAHKRKSFWITSASPREVCSFSPVGIRWYASKTRGRRARSRICARGSQQKMQTRGRQSTL